jgi:Uma2 family endonuclease
VERRHPSTRLTYTDLELLPDDGLRHEIIDGEHYVTASPVTQHQRISRRLVVAFQSYLDAQPMGEVFYAPFDVVMSFHDVVVPDLIYISQSRAQLVTAKNLQGAPDLVIEILSPSTRSRDERLKRELYERAGVEEYWIIDPDRNVVLIYRRQDAHFLPPDTFDESAVIETALLPGFELPLGDVLADS